MVAEEVGFLPSAVLSFEEPRMLKAESFELDAMILKWNVERGMWNVDVDVDVCGYER